MQTDLNLFRISANLPLSYIDVEFTLPAGIWEFRQRQIRSNQSGSRVREAKLFNFTRRFGQKCRALSRPVGSGLNEIIHPDLGPNTPYGDRTDMAKTPVAQNDAWEAIKSLIGIIDGPSDWASEHDHYLYGFPKRT